MLRNCVGWGGGDDNVPCTCTHGPCYATDGLWFWDDNVPCTCTHGRRYATHGVGVGWGDVNIILDICNMVPRSIH